MGEAKARHDSRATLHTPPVNFYIRSADEKDLKQISEIYNYYVLHSVVAIESEPLTEQQWRGRWIDATESNYAFLVAVQMNPKGTSSETVCGFAYSDDFGDDRSAWRYTCELQCYVGNWTLRTGIGKSLVDRMMSALDPTYVVRAGAKLEGIETPIRDEGCGVRVIHKVVINISHSAKDLDTLEWQKQWLAKFQFAHAVTLPGVGRKFGKVYVFYELLLLVDLANVWHKPKSRHVYKGDWQRSSKRAITNCESDFDTYPPPSHNSLLVSISSRRPLSGNGPVPGPAFCFG
ncbi:hypothetical protein MMC07_000649 [Pseudocyphellaria aurata]|nr:hypothetical protein [Pseudocyphellaria aurata]